jgi:hypothetical protein
MSNLISNNGQLAVHNGFLALGVSSEDLQLAWRALGTGASSDVKKVFVSSAGDLYAAGTFATMDNITVNQIAKWDGNSWSAIGEGISLGVPQAIAEDSLGNIYFGAQNLFKWDGTNLSTVLTTNFSITDMAFDSNENLYFVGGFSSAGGVTCNNIGKWDGTNVTSIGSGVNTAAAGLDVAIDSSDNIYVAGNFTNIDGVPAQRIAVWDGIAWSAMSTGFSEMVYDVYASGNDVYAAGFNYSQTGSTVNKWNPANNNWEVVGSHPYTAYELQTYNGNLIAVDDIGVHQYINSSWELIPTIYSSIAGARTLAIKNDEIFIGGTFTSINSQTGSISANRIAKYGYSI